MKPRHTKIGEYSAKSEPLPTPTVGPRKHFAAVPALIAPHESRVGDLRRPRVIRDGEKLHEELTKMAFFKALGVNGTNKPAVIMHEDYIWPASMTGFVMGHAVTWPG